MVYGFIFMLPGLPIDALSSSLIMRGQSTVQSRVEPFGQPVSF